MPEPGADAAPRGIWSGVISFGLVSIPVELYPGQRSSTPALRLLDEDGTPLERRYMCPGHGRILSRDELARGYELEEGRFVVVTDEELEDVAPEKTRQIELRRFVDLADVDPLHFDRPYFLTPLAESARAYHLLAETMEKEGRAGLATFVMRGREHVVAILAQSRILRAETLLFPREVCSPEDVGLSDPPGEAEGGEVKAFREAISALAADALEEDELHDQRAARLRELAQGKREAGRDVVEVEAEEVPSAAKVIDLMEVIRRRLEQPSRKPSSGDRLEELSKEELYERAKERDVPGRSSMRKEDLVEALRKAGAS